MTVRIRGRWTSLFLVLAFSIPAITLVGYLINVLGGCSGDLKSAQNCAHISEATGEWALVVFIFGFLISAFWTPFWLLAAFIREVFIKRPIKQTFTAPSQVFCRAPAPGSMDDIDARR